MESVRIGIITAPRAKSTLAATLRALKASDAASVPIAVFSDSVEPPQDSAGASCVFTATQEKLDAIKREKWYGTTNLIRAWRWAAEAAWVISLEDDVLFPSRWLGAALGVAKRLEDPFVLSLHDMFSDEEFREIHELALEAGSITAWRSTKRVWANGSQAYVMRSSVARGLADLLEDKIASVPLGERWRWVMDCGVLSGHVDAGSYVLYQTDPCLCMHMDFAESTWAPSSISREEARTKRFRPF